MLSDDRVHFGERVALELFEHVDDPGPRVFGIHQQLLINSDCSRKSRDVRITKYNALPRQTRDGSNVDSERPEPGLIRHGPVII